MPQKKTNAMMKSLEGIGSAALFAMRLITDAFRAPFEVTYIRQEVADQGWRSLPLIISSGIALGFVMTLHTRKELIRFGASAWIPTLQSLSFFVEIGPLLAALLMAGRVGAGMGASLAEMRATEQIDAIEALSVDSFKLLVVPRVAACVIALPLLTTFMDVCGIIRLDHFRGFAAVWHVRADAPTAETGNWVPGPGADLVQTLQRELGSLPFIAEDLGIITPDVVALRDQYRLPGTRVLQFAFDGNRQNPHLPHNYPESVAAYTGTHDNNTTRGWYDTLPSDQKQNLWNYVGRRFRDSEEVAGALMHLVWESPAALAMTPLQDVLNLGEEARMNVPGSSDGNWHWRCMETMMSDARFAGLRDLTKATNRSSSLRLLSKESLVGTAS
jgi:4-alpha-glucanotransferase/Permease MlaE